MNKTGKTFIADPLACVAAISTSIVCLCIAGISLYRQYWGSLCVFLVLGSIFAVISVLRGSRVHLSSAGLHHTIFGKTVGEWKWEELSEIGVVGTKAFRVRSDSVGRLFLYFSPKTMTDEERFEMILKWPPSKISYLAFQEERLLTVKYLSKKSIISYNTGGRKY